MRKITNVQLSQSTGWGIRIESQTHFCFVDPDLTGLQFPDLNTGEKIMNHKYLWHLWGTGTPCLLCDSQPPTCVLRSNFRSPCVSLGILTGLVSCFHVLTPPPTPPKFREVWQKWQPQLETFPLVECESFCDWEMSRTPRWNLLLAKGLA